MIAQVVAVDEQYGIGFENKLLFSIPEDMKFFRKQTITNEYGEQNYVIMGRNTYDSLGIHYLPERKNIVLSRNSEFKPHHKVVVENDIDKIVNHHKQSENKSDIYVIGGSQLYEQFAPYTDKIYMTKICKEAVNVDTYYPSYILRDFHITNVEEHYSDKYDCRYEFITYERNKMSVGGG